MWQRIQTLYLAISALSLILIPFFFPLFAELLAQVQYVHHHIWATLAIFGAAALNITSIFQFKKRKLQVVLGRLSILILAAGFVYLLYTFYDKSKTSDVGFGLAIIAPLIGIFLTSLANKAIIKDEEMIKAADRLR